MHRTVATLKRHPPHRMVDDPDAPGTCRVCHVTDNPVAPRNELHDEAVVAAYEAEIADRQEQSQRRAGE